MRSRHAARDCGMVTAELAAALPVLVILLGVALTAVTIAGQRVRVADAAREAARAAARGDPSAAAWLVRQAAPGAAVSITRVGDRVIAQVRMTVRPVGGWLPGLQVVERAVAAAEPQARNAIPP